jgi:nucleotide-binding universal stress UspA family protein
MLRHTVVPIDGIAENGPCEQMAVQFTRNYGGRLIGIYLRACPPQVVPDDFLNWGIATPGLSTAVAVDPVYAEETLKDFEMREDRRQAEVVGPFLQRAAAAGIEASVETCASCLEEALQGVGLAADLVVMGHRSAESSVLLSEAGVMVRTGRKPFLLVGEETRTVGRVGVAFDGSPGSYRALRLAADLAVNWKTPIKELYLITATEAEVAPVSHMEHARSYLDSYGLSVNRKVLYGASTAQIVPTALDLDVDLLCAGAYGHSFMRDVLFGSTTQKLITDWRRPLLVCH